MYYSTKMATNWLQPCILHDLLSKNRRNLSVLIICMIISLSFKFLFPLKIDKLGFRSRNTCNSRSWEFDYYKTQKWIGAIHKSLYHGMNGYRREASILAHVGMIHQYSKKFRYAVGCALVLACSYILEFAILSNAADCAYDKAMKVSVNRI